MRSIIVYFSLEGNARLIAKKLAENLGADTLELATEKPYPDSGAKKFFVGGKSASFKETPALMPYDFSPDDYDLIVLGCPIWAGQIAPPLRTFLLDNPVRGKKLAMFVTCGGGSPKKAFLELQKCALARSTDITAALRFVEPLKMDADELENTISEFGARIIERSGL